MPTGTTTNNKRNCLFGNCHVVTLGVSLVTFGFYLSAGSTAHGMVGLHTGIGTLADAD
jgi:hypothetical protein